jgi:hypothetical protein
MRINNSVGIGEMRAKGMRLTGGYDRSLGEASSRNICKPVEKNG